MLRQHKISTATGAVGALILLSHLLLGPEAVPVPAVLSGLALVGAAALGFVRAGRRDGRDREVA